MDGHAALAALRAGSSLLRDSPKVQQGLPVDIAINDQPNTFVALDSFGTQVQGLPATSANICGETHVPHGDGPCVEDPCANEGLTSDAATVASSRVASSSKRSYKPNRAYAARVGVKQKPNKTYTGQKDGMALVRKRAVKLPEKMGVRMGMLTDGQGQPKPARKAVRRDAVFELVPNVPGTASLEPLSSVATFDVVWKEGVERLTCGARNERFELLRRLTLGNLPFVASMSEANVAASPDIRGDLHTCAASI